MAEVDPVLLIDTPEDDPDSRFYDEPADPDGGIPVETLRAIRNNRKARTGLPAGEAVAPVATPPASVDAEVIALQVAELLEGQLKPLVQRVDRIEEALVAAAMQQEAMLPMGQQMGLPPAQPMALPPGQELFGAFWPHLVAVAQDKNCRRGILHILRTIQGRSKGPLATMFEYGLLLIEGSEAEEI